MKKETCENCKYWLHSEVKNDIPGDCRKYPPIFRGIWGETSDRFPTTKKEDFCGEFKRSGKIKKVKL